MLFYLRTILVLFLITLGASASAQETGDETARLLSELNQVAESLDVSVSDAAEHPLGKAVLDKFWWDTTGKPVMHAFFAALFWSAGTVIVLLSYKAHFHRRWRTAPNEGGADFKNQVFDTVIEVDRVSKDAVMGWHLAAWIALSVVSCGWIWSTL